MSSHRWKPLVATARAGRIRGAGSEYPAERPVLTVAQVFKHAELVGRRPVGDIRKLPGGGYRLRFQRDGVVRTAREVCPARAVTDRTLWEMAADGRADSSHDSRYRALVLLAAFASLRRGEGPLCVAATWVWTLAQCGFAPRSPRDLRVRSSLVCPSPEPTAGSSAFPARSSRPCASTYQASSPTIPVRWFPGPKGVPLRCGNFDRQASWPHAVRAIGAEGLHFMISSTPRTHGRPGVAWGSGT